MNERDSSIGKMIGVIKYPDSFKVSKEFLMKLVENYTMRSFSEEIDKLEAFRGIFHRFNPILFYVLFKQEMISQKKGLQQVFPPAYPCFIPMSFYIERKNTVMAGSRNNEVMIIYFLNLIILKGFPFTFFKSLKSPILLIWLLCSFLALCIDLSFLERRMPIVWVDALAIILLFLVTLIISVVNDYQTERKIEEIQRLAHMEQVINCIFVFYSLY